MFGFVYWTETKWTFGSIDDHTSSIHCSYGHRNDRLNFMLFLRWAHITKWNYSSSYVWYNCHTICIIHGYMLCGRSRRIMYSIFYIFFIQIDKQRDATTSKHVWTKTNHRIETIEQSNNAHNRYVIHALPFYPLKLKHIEDLMHSIFILNI